MARIASSGARPRLIDARIAATIRRIRGEAPPRSVSSTSTCDDGLARQRRHT